MPDPISLIALGAAVGGAAGKFTDKAWEASERWLKERDLAHTQQMGLNSPLLPVRLLSQVDSMIQTFEAIIEPDGRVQLLEDVQLTETRRALVTILEDEPASTVPVTALLSEQALAEDWNRPEEDEAWSYLQQDQ
jgi:hypothetical protein